MSTKLTESVVQDLRIALAKLFEQMMTDKVKQMHCR